MRPSYRAMFSERGTAKLTQQEKEAILDLCVRMYLEYTPPSEPVSACPLRMSGSKWFVVIDKEDYLLRVMSDEEFEKEADSYSWPA